VVEGHRVGTAAGAAIGRHVDALAGGQAHLQCAGFQRGGAQRAVDLDAFGMTRPGGGGGMQRGYRAAPEADRGGGVRTLPLTEIGPFRLEGALSPRELADWAEAAARGEGWPAYLSHLLDQRRFDEALARVRERPAVLAELLGLLADPHTSLATRIGIGALVEDLAGSHALRAAIPQLATLTLSAWPQTRADACHYLGMTGDPAVIPAVRQLLDDDQAEVREIAAETLALMGDVDNPWDEETP
jgi:hypothetical protein